MDIQLTKIEKKILRAFWLYQYADIDFQELNGYLHFPPIEQILTALYRLEKHDFIRKSDVPNHGYKITEEGRLYEKHHGIFFFRNPVLRHDILVGIISSAIGGIIVALLKP